MPPSLIGEFSSLNNFFEYLDQDIKRSVKRYSSELVEQHQWRHDLSDLPLFMELIKHVLGNIERYIAPPDGAEHGGTGTGTGNTGEQRGRDGAKKDGLGCLDQSLICCITICIKASWCSASTL